MKNFLPTSSESMANIPSFSTLVGSVLTPLTLATLFSTGVLRAQTPHGVVLLETMKREGKTDFSPTILAEWKEGKTGVFNLSSINGDWSESVTGAIYSPTESLQFDLGAGFEKTRSKDPTARFTFITSYSKKDNNIFLVFEKGEKTPLEHRVFISHKVNDILKVGLTSRNGKGSGPYAAVQLTKNAGLTAGVETLPHRGANYFLQGNFSF